MTFKAIVTCDSPGCEKESVLDCSHPDDAGSDIFDLDGWFVCAEKHYCPFHAQKAKERWIKENPPLKGIHKTMVG